MDTRITIAALAVATAALAGCAMGNPLSRMGWTSPRLDATAQIRTSCEASVQTLRGQPDYNTALHACLQAMTRQAKS